jgi:hypothetical protein
MDTLARQRQKPSTAIEVPSSEPGWTARDLGVFIAITLATAALVVSLATVFVAWYWRANPIILFGPDTPGPVG